MTDSLIKILLIEDDPGDARIIEIMLATGQTPAASDLLSELTWSQQLSDGLERLAQAPVDLVLLDLTLPDSSGLDTFLRVQEHAPHVPIVIITGVKDSDLAIQAVRSGAQDYLLKGQISRDLLVRSIRHAIQRQGIRVALDESTRRLQASDARFRIITEKITDGIVIVNRANIVQFVNPAAEILFNTQRAAFTGQPFPFPLTPGKDAEVQIASSSNMPEITAELQAVEIMWEGEPAYLVSLHNLTPRKKMEAALQEAKSSLEATVKARTAELNKVNQYLLDQISERRRTQRALNRALVEAEQARDQIDTIFKSVADGLIATDVQHRITMMNRAAEEIFGITTDVTGYPIDSVISSQALCEHIEKTLVENSKGYSFEFTIPVLQPTTTNNNSLKQKIIRARTAAITDRAQHPGGVITIMYDITRDREVDRLKTEFISTAAHELRTPLTTLLGFSEILLARDDLSQEVQRRHLAYINNQALALARIVDNLLDISRFEAGRNFLLNKTPGNIGNLIRQIVARYRRQTEKHQFVVELADDDQDWIVDQQKITQALENLLDNATKFSPADSEIRVTGQSYQDPQSAQSYYYVAVRDDGIGMTLAQVTRIFNQFYRGDASNTAVGGTGLGMTIVKHIVEAHGGRIWVDSKPGEGTKVSFTVPLGT